MKKTFFSILLLAAMGFGTQAAPIVNETFTYANGALTAVAPAGTWLHFSGAANQLDVAAGKAHLTQAETEDVDRALGVTIGFGGTIYFGFDIIVATPPAAGAAPNPFAHLGNATTTVQLAKVFLVPGSVAGTYRVGVANGATAPSAVFPVDLLPGATRRVVVRLDTFATGAPPQTTLWIDPCSVQSSSVAATDSFNPGFLTVFVLRQEPNIGVLDVDNLRFPEQVGGDTTPPVITCPANITTPATSATGAIVTFAPTVSDDTDPSPTVTCAPPSGSTFPIGATQVICNARDRCGNVSRCVFVVTVTQVPPLQITCSADITVGTTTTTGATVNYPAPTVTGGCPPYGVVCNPPSGSTFPIGTTSVNCVASDTCNHSIECVFKVTVVRRVIEVDTMPFGLAQLTLAKGNSTEVVSLAGPTTVNVYFEGATEGSAMDDDGDGRDEVQTEMVAMDLHGMSSMGPVQVVLDPTQRSLGQIEETANATPGTLDIPPFTAGGSADSFFDVFVEIRVGTGATAMVLHPARPLHMQGVIKHKPPGPGDTYVNPFTDPVPLLDANGNDTGIRIVREVHTPNPEQERDSFTYTQGKINLRNPNGQIERIIVAGPTEVLVNIPPNGAAADTDGNGLDEVPMEMTSLNLAGNSSLGPVLVMLDTARCRSFGKIEEKVNNTPGILDLPPFTATGGANSSFDLCLKIVVGGKVFRPCNNVLVHIASMISHKPPGPGEAYMNLIDQEIPLCDENGAPTGYVLTGEMHTPNLPKEIDFFSNTVAQLTVQLPNGGTEVVTLNGPTRVEVSINDADGLAADTDGDGLDQVPTQMTLLNLAGNSSIGPVQVSLRADRPSLGEIEETANNTPGVLDVPPFAAAGTANSYFDIWPVITVGGQTYFTAAPLHMASVIHHKPPAPGDEYVNPFTQPVELLDAAGNHTGIFIIREVHTPNPNCTVGIACPSNVVVWTCSPNGLAVNYPPPTATSSCNLRLDITCVPPSGSNFAPGNTPVVCTAKDSVGNSASCTFLVRVTQDITPPHIVCPGDIKVETCHEREQVFYAVTATDDCDTNVTIVCNPPSGSSFPPGTTPVLCRATDDCGHSSECRFLVTVTRLPDASLTIRRLSDGRLVMCWSAPCDDYVLQCTRSLNTPILWETIPGPYPGTAAQHCVTNSPNNPHQFYRLKKRGPNEVFEPTGTLPPQGAYMSPSDETTVILSTPTAGGPPRRMLARWFVHPIPVPTIVVPRPPPCLTCPPDTFEFHSKLDFQVSPDEGQTWAEVSLITDVAVLVGFNPQPDPPGVWTTEILRLDAVPGPAGEFSAAALTSLRLRESPTLPSKGKTTIRQLEDGTFRVGSFFDIFVEASLDGGQTWMPLQTPVHMELSPRAPTVPEALDAFPPAGTYDSPSGQVTRYANGLLVRQIVHPNPTDSPLPFPPKPNPPCLTCPPASYRFTTDVQFDLSTDGGLTWMPAGGTADEVVRARLGRQVGGARFFDTEMLALNIHGGGVGVLPNLVMIRESPTRSSKGMTSIRESPSLSRPYIVESFFDIFTELSTDGGQTWAPSTEATHVELNPQPFPPGQ